MIHRYEIDFFGDVYQNNIQKAPSNFEGAFCYIEIDINPI